MQQVIINVGISGSGKTTWSSDFIKNNENWLRINRDDIRKTLVGNLDGYYQRKDLNNIEELVSKLENNCFTRVINSQYNIIIDNTNLKKDFINRHINTLNFLNNSQLYDLKEKYNIDYKFKIFDVPVQRCIERVSKRDTFLTNIDYIYKQYQQFEQIKQYLETNYKNKII